MTNTAAQTTNAIFCSFCDEATLHYLYPNDDTQCSNVHDAKNVGTVTIAHLEPVDNGRFFMAIGSVGAAYKFTAQMWWADTQYIDVFDAKTGDAVVTRWTKSTKLVKSEKSALVQAIASVLDAAIEAEMASQVRAANG